MAVRKGEIQMRALPRLLALVAAAALVGCGGEKPEAADKAPFEAALVEYLRVNSMEMKPDRFESLDVSGSKAIAKVRMATKDDLYGMKPLWTVTFEKSGEGWVVGKVDR
jgi:hypothetical protein